MSGQFPDLWLINGLVGMPGMVGRAVSMEIQPSSGSGDIFDLLPTVDLLFADAVPAGGGHRYSIPLTAKSFDLTSEDTVHGNDPLPAQAPLPMLFPTVGFQGRHASGSFILDTGAAISFIAPRLATSLGLDSNGDGQFDDGDDQSFGTLPIGGIGGTVEAPLFNIDTFRLATDEGIDLIWDSVQVLVLDIHPDIDGVLGADVLTSGWVDLFDTSPDTGPIKQVLFDFTQFQVEGDRGSLFLELDPSHDLVQSGGRDGDFDGDGDTDGDDLDLWQAGFGTTLVARVWSTVMTTWMGLWRGPTFYAGREIVLLAISQPRTTAISTATARLTRSICPNGNPDLSMGLTPGAIFSPGSEIWGMSVPS